MRFGRSAIRPANQCGNARRDFVARGKWHCTEVGREDNYAILSVELHVRGRYKQRGQRKEKELQKNACGDIESDREA